MKINIIHPNEEYNFDFEIKCFFQVTSTHEVFALGHNYDLHHDGKLELLGMIPQKELNTMFFYDIRYIGEKYYEKLDKMNIGNKTKIRSNINSGFWADESAIKVDSTIPMQYLNELGNYRMCTKINKNYYIFPKNLVV